MGSAGIISAVGYIGFTSSQLLDGAKLASARFDGLNMNTSFIFMEAIRATLPADFLKLNNIAGPSILSWAVTIIPLSYLFPGRMNVLV